MSETKKLTFKKAYPIFLTIAAFLGLFASFVLVVEEIHLIENPDQALGCDINPIVACSAALQTDQGHIFGFPNPLLGVAAFGVLLGVAAAMLAGAKFKKWFWQGLQAGVTFGVIGVHWFIFQSIYVLETLCPYCMLTWLVVIPIFWYTTLHNLRSGNILLPKSLDKAVKFSQRHHTNIMLVWILAIVGLITQHFWYYWSTLI